MHPFNKCIHSCNHYHNPDLEYFHPPPKFPCDLLQSVPIILTFFPYRLFLYSRISCNSIYPLCLVSPIQQADFAIHLCYCVYQ